MCTEKSGRAGGKRAARCDQGMFEQKEIQKLDDYFLPLSRRPGGGCTFFYRISGYSSRIEEFTVSYFQAAVKKGAAVEGRIPNPTEQNLSYYEEIMGNRAGSDVPSITSDLKMRSRIRSSTYATWSSYPHHS